MDYIKELYQIQNDFDEYTLHSFIFSLKFHDGEIIFSYYIRCVFDVVFEYSNNFNACDRETNLKGLDKEIMNINYKNYIK